MPAASSRAAQINALRGPLDDLPDPLPIPVLERPFALAFAVPGSKSLTNRALLLAALASGQSRLRRPLADADDVQRMRVALGRLGAVIEDDGEDVLVRGVGGRWPVPKSEVLLDCGGAGTAARFLTAAALLAASGSSRHQVGDVAHQEPGLGEPTHQIIIDGNARLRERPIAELVELLRTLGATVHYEHAHGGLPVRIEPPDDLAALADEVRIGQTLSSQFISALMLIAPFLPRGLTFRFTGPPTSVAYVHMTLGLLRRVGVGITGEPPADVRVFPAAPPLGDLDITIEPDASSATYFWAAAALTPGAGWATPGLMDSLQPDAGFVNVLAKMGAAASVENGRLGVRGAGQLRGIDIDLRDMPDAAMTLAAAACAAAGRTAIRGLRTLRNKETDRIAALQRELGKIGVGIEVSEQADDVVLGVHPPNITGPTDTNPAPVVFDTYDDHRMAMSLALIGLHRPNVFINDPGCVRKTYPGFWSDLGRLYGK